MSFDLEVVEQYSMQRLMLKFNLQYFGHLIGITDLLEKSPMLGKIKGRSKGEDRR